MRLPRLARKFLDLIRQRGARRPGPRKGPGATRCRPRLLPLEDRCVPATASATVSGVAFIDANHDGRREASETVLVGAPVTLGGSTAQGRIVNVTAFTAADGTYQFLNVLPGNYRLVGDSNAVFLGGPLSKQFTVRVGEPAISSPVPFSGFNPALLSVRSLLSSNTATNLVGSTPGTGFALANFRPNNKPTVSDAITVAPVSMNAPDTNIDLAANFTDPDLNNNTVVRIDTTMGPINLQLFDRATPQTVANFMNYVLSHRYDNSIFHRLAFTGSQKFVLQGGGFKFTPGSLDTIHTDPSVANEFRLVPNPANPTQQIPFIPNTTGTIAMAKGNDPNSATDEFFFNLNNNTTLDSTTNAGGFTVFGKIVSAADQAVLNKLTSPPVASKDVSGFAATDPNHQNSPFTEVPLIGYTGKTGAQSKFAQPPTGTAGHFTTDAKASNLEIIKDVQVLRRDEFLNYTVIANSNPSLVTTSLNNNGFGLHGNHLTLHYAANKTGTATITVRATDRFGASVTTKFTVTVNP
jgi:cyclophilin family peptidyl-prolyl cis-trans isomerase